MVGSRYPRGKGGSGLQLLREGKAVPAAWVRVCRRKHEKERLICAGSNPAGAESAVA